MSAGPPLPPRPVARRRWSVAVAPAVVLLLTCGEAWARAGGGHGYSGGGGSDGGGGGSGGGGGGVDIGFLVWLLLEHPVIGVPVLIVVAYIWYQQQQHRRGGQGREVVRTHRNDRPVARGPVDLSWLLARDPSFSLPLFLDLARLVFLRAHEERGRKGLAALQAYLTPEASAALAARSTDLDAVRDVIVGSSQLVAARLAGADAYLSVRFESNLTEVRGGRPQQLLLREVWTFGRTADTRSPGPDKMRALSCPSCGSPAETRTDGTCRSCDAVLDDGRLQWHVVGVELQGAEPLPPILLQPGAGVEEGTRLPLVTAPDLGPRMRELAARHPDFTWPAFQARVVATFGHIQEAWSEGRYDLARPYETDFLYQQHRYWVERYAREGYRNRLADVEVTSVAPAKVVLDAWVEAVTVRVFARMRDWTEDRDGRVIGGSKTSARVFSEYWTFLRSAGARSAPHELEQCPSCGAPLDRVNETGVCGYCEAKITGGDFDWVLSGIEQDEAYRG